MDENTKEEKIIEPINVKVEIDYDELATAIVKAQKLVERGEIPQDEVEESEITNKKLNKLQKLGLKIRRKINQLIFDFKKESITTKIFALFVWVCFLTIGLLGVFLSPTFITMRWEEIILFFGGNLGVIYYYIFFVGAEMFSIVFIFASIEILISKDRNFIISVFSALTSLVAMIISLIALFK